MIAVDPSNQREPNAFESGERRRVGEYDARRQQGRDVFSQAARKLLQHALLGIGSRDAHALVSEIVLETRNDLGRFQTELNETFIQIEQIAVLTPLQECTQLGASRVSSNQVGTYDGSTSLQMASGAALALPASCSGVSIPLGAPVLVFRIERPAAPVTEMARTEFRSVPCENDSRGMQQRGTMVQSRVVRYTAEGVITPSDPNVGWATEELGNCVSDAIVTADSVANAEGGSIALDNFADLAAQGMKGALEEQLKMGCTTTNISSDILTRDGAGVETRSKKDKDIENCAKASASAAGGQVSETAIGNLADTRDVCVEKSIVSGDKAFLGVNAGTLRSDFAGTAFVDRIVDIVGLSTDGSQRGKRDRWVGRAAIDCKSSDATSPIAQTCRASLRIPMPRRRAESGTRARSPETVARATRAAGADCFSTACGGA